MKGIFNHKPRKKSLVLFLGEKCISSLTNDFTQSVTWIWFLKHTSFNQIQFLQPGSWHSKRWSQLSKANLNNAIMIHLPLSRFELILLQMEILLIWYRLHCCPQTPQPTRAFSLPRIALSTYQHRRAPMVVLIKQYD